MNIADNVKAQIAEAAKNAVSGLMFDDQFGTALFEEYKQYIQDQTRQGLAYLVRLKKHKVKRGYAPRYVECHRLLGEYKTNLTVHGSTLIMETVVLPFASVEEIKGSYENPKSV